MVDLGSTCTLRTADSDCGGPDFADEDDAAESSTEHAMSRKKRFTIPLKADLLASRVPSKDHALSTPYNSSKRPFLLRP